MSNYGDVGGGFESCGAQELDAVVDDVGYLARGDSEDGGVEKEGGSGDDGKNDEVQCSCFYVVLLSNNGTAN